MKPNTPEVSIPFYSNQNKEFTVNIFSKKIKINSFTVKAVKGFNQAVFDLSFSKKGRKEYQKVNKGVVVSEAKNGLYYLPKGMYIVKIEQAEVEFEVK